MIYLDPFEFDPTRWIRALRYGIDQNKYHISFGNGNRGCIGTESVFLPVCFIRLHETEFLPCACDYAEPRIGLLIAEM